MNSQPQAAWRLEPLAHRDAGQAARIHAVWLPAYRQEAALLGLDVFEPLNRSPEEIQSLDEHFLGALRGDELLGCLSLAEDDVPGQILVCCLVVHPRHQRQGVARALMQRALQWGAARPFVVATAAANAPALALYSSLGFEIYRRGSMGLGALELVKLRRAP